MRDVQKPVGDRGMRIPLELVFPQARSIRHATVGDLNKTK